MFVEVFEHAFNCGTKPTDPVIDIGIVSVDKVVNTSLIRTIDIIETTSGGRKYHRIWLENSSEETIGKVYISDKDYERIIHS